MQLYYERITNGEGEVLDYQSAAGGLLEYELTATDTGDSVYPKSYSVSVRSRLCGEAMTATVSDVTVNEQYARELFERAVLYDVTAVSLHEVTEDFLAEKY